MNLRLTRSFASAVVLALAAFALADPSASQQIDVRIEIAGRAFAGQLTAVEPAPASMPPTSQPVAAEEPAIVLAGGGAPFVVHLDAGDVIDPTKLRETRVHWDFGDATPGSRFNAIDGYNAAHIYDAPGVYTITRTVDSPAGQTSVRVQLEVKPANRKAIYVSADGDDKADGATPEHAVKTWARAIAAIGPNVELRFRRGDRFVIDRPVTVRGDDVRLTGYGDEGKPRPLMVVERQLPATFTIEAVGRRLIIDELAFDATYFGNDMGKASLPDLIHPGEGGGLVVRRCEFRNLNTVINGNSRPHGVLVLDNDLPLETGLRSYFTWIEGDDWTLLGNHAANSTREHIVRVGGGGGERVNIQFNDFHNLDRRAATAQTDPNDTAKATLNIQKGRVLYVAHNWLHGANGVGPLGQKDGLADKEGRWIGAVVEYNRIDGFIEVKHGASFVIYRDNVVRADDSIAFPIDGFDRQYGRGVSDVWYEHNTVVDAGKTGNFAALQTGAKNVHMTDNLYIAPQLVPGAYQASAIYTNEPDLRAFAQIARNVWPTAQPNGWAQGGVHYVAAQWGEQAGYRDPAEWAAMSPPVEGDRFENVTDLSLVQFGGAGVENPALLPAARP